MLRSQLDLAKLLLELGPARDVARARALLAEVAQHAKELGMPPVQRAAESLSASSAALP